jgi:UDP:flavonoid glycosyltransferase YjiC (YdhE family)
MSARPRQRVLFVAEAVTLAHVARPMVLARALDPQRHAVEFAWDPRYARLFPKPDFPLHQITTIPGEQFEAALASGSPLYDAPTLRRYVEQDLQLLERVRPDVVVGDFRLSLAVSAAVAKVPYLNLSNAYWSPYARQHFPVPELPVARLLGVRLGQLAFTLARPLAFALHARPLNTVRREHGLPALGHDLRHSYTWGDHTLYADIPELFTTQALPPNHHFLGPILWSPTVPEPEWWDALAPDRPAVYVTLGSSGRSELLPMVLEALAGLAVTVIAATAGRVSITNPPANAFVADYLPGEAAAARARLVICNGGSPTTQQALTAGVPVLGIAGNLDQYLNMQAVAASGAGRLLRAGKASVDALREAAAALLVDEESWLAARRLAREFARYNATERFVELLGRLG